MKLNENAQVIIQFATLEDAVILKQNYSQLVRDAESDDERQDYIKLFSAADNRIKELA